MSWFNFTWSQEDRQLQHKWRNNIGNNIRFYDEITDCYYEPQEEALPVPILVSDDFEENELDKITITKSGKKKRTYKPRKPIPVMTKNQLIALRGFNCEVCKINPYNHIHHIDKNPINNDWTNLQLVCRLCHKKIHAKH